MKLLLALTALLPTLALANVQKGEPYDSYILSDLHGPVHVKLVTDFQTQDSCNSFGLEGRVKAVEGDRQSLEQILVADLGVVQTEMGCPPAPHPRSIHLESQAYTIQPIAGTVDARLLVPNKFRLVVLP